MNKWQEKVNFKLGRAMDEMKSLYFEIRNIECLSLCLAEVRVKDGFGEHPNELDLRVAQQAVAKRTSEFAARFQLAYFNVVNALQTANSTPFENELIERAENFQESVNSISK